MATLRGYFVFTTFTKINVANLFISSIMTNNVYGSNTLTMRGIKIPYQVDLREEVTLISEFSLDGEGLYSVKWYKDSNEFYRYMPESPPSELIYPVHGVHLSSYKSNLSLSEIKLKDLSFQSSGLYRCEVSAEAPSFQTAIQQGNMTVMAFPDHDPLIDGIRTEYTLGDYVTGNCSSAPSNPLASLTWFINDNKAEDWLVVNYGTNVETINNVQLYMRIVGLRFQLFKQHFTGSEQKMKLTCIATVGERSWQRVVSSTLANNLTNQKLAQERHDTSGAATLASCIALITLVMTSHGLS